MSLADKKNFLIDQRSIFGGAELKKKLKLVPKKGPSPDFKSRNELLNSFVKDVHILVVNIYWNCVEPKNIHLCKRHMRYSG